MTLTAKQVRGFKYARDAFNESDYVRHPVGASFLDGTRVTVASNSLKTKPLAKRLGSRFERLHAEMNCLLNVTDCTRGELYVYRERKDGRLAMSRPCCACETYLKSLGVRRVYYTIDGGFASETY